MWAYKFFWPGADYDLDVERIESDYLLTLQNITVYTLEAL